MANTEICRKIEDVLKKYLADKEIELYGVTYRKEGPDKKLRVVLDKPASSKCEYVSIDECESVTRYLNEFLDATDFMKESYTLEVSSPGLDRELKTLADMERFSGRLVDIKLYSAVDGIKEFTAVLKGCDKDNKIIAFEYEGRTHELPEDKIAKINLAVVF